MLVELFMSIDCTSDVMILPGFLTEAFLASLTEPLTDLSDIYEISRLNLLLFQPINWRKRSFTCENNLLLMKFEFTNAQRLEIELCRKSNQET